MVVSTSEEMPVPRVRKRASISSKKTMTGTSSAAYSLALTKISRIFLIVEPDRGGAAGQTCAVDRGRARTIERVVGQDHVARAGPANKQTVRVSVDRVVYDRHIVHLGTRARGAAVMSL